MAVAVAAYSMTPPMIQNHPSRNTCDSAFKLRLTNVHIDASSITIEWNGATMRLKLFGLSIVSVNPTLTMTTSGTATRSAVCAALSGCQRASAQSATPLTIGQKM